MFFRPTHLGFRQVVQHVTLSNVMELDEGTSFRSTANHSSLEKAAGEECMELDTVAIEGKDVRD